MVFIHETHVMKSSGKVKTKRYLLSWFLQAVSAALSVSCSKQEQITTLRTFGWVLVAPIFSHYIDWWCLFMKHMWCHQVAKYKLKRHLLSYLVLAGIEYWAKKSVAPNRNKLIHYVHFIWNWLHPSSGIILIDGVYSWNTVWCHLVAK